MREMGVERAGPGHQRALRGLLHSLGDLRAKGSK